MVTATKQPRVVKDAEELIRDMTEAIEPIVARGTIVEEGVPMMVGNTMSAGMVLLYDTRTGVSSIFHRNNLKNGLKRRREDGSLMYTSEKLDIVDTTPKLPCWLHGDHPDRPLYAKMGLKTCTKVLSSVQHVRVHMMKRHKSEWDAIEADSKNTIEIEERQLRRLTILKLTDNTTATASATVTVAQVNETVAEPIRVEQLPVSKACVTCGEVLTGKTMGGWNMKKFHHDKKHPKAS